MNNSHNVSSSVNCRVTYRPAAVVRGVEKWGDTAEKATELCLGLLAGSTLKYILKHIKMTANETKNAFHF